MNKIWKLFELITGTAFSKIIYRTSEMMQSLIVWVIAYFIMTAYTDMIPAYVFIIGASYTFIAKWIFSGRVWDYYSPVKKELNFGNIIDLALSFLGGRK